MNHLILTVVATIITVTVSAQSDKMVKWMYFSKKIAVKTYEIHLKATIASTYHLYSQNPGSDGPLPTRFIFNTNPQATMSGKPKETGKLINIYDNAWKGKVRYFEKTVDFVQVVKIKAATTITGKIEFMVSNHKEAQPPSEVPFTIRVGQ